MVHYSGHGPDEIVGSACCLAFALFSKLADSVIKTIATDWLGFNKFIGPNVMNVLRCRRWKIIDFYTTRLSQQIRRLRKGLFYLLAIRLETPLSAIVRWPRTVSTRNLVGLRCCAVVWVWRVANYVWCTFLRRLLSLFRQNLHSSRLDTFSSRDSVARQTRLN